jgi:hypothetical protein
MSVKTSRCQNGAEASPAEQVHCAWKQRVRRVGAAGDGRHAHQAQPLPLGRERLLVLHVLVQPAGRQSTAVAGCWLWMVSNAAVQVGGLNSPFGSTLLLKAACKTQESAVRSDMQLEDEEQGNAICDAGHDQVQAFYQMQQSTETPYSVRAVTWRSARARGAARRPPAGRPRAAPWRSARCRRPARRPPPPSP